MTARFVASAGPARMPMRCAACAAPARGVASYSRLDQPLLTVCSERVVQAVSGDLDAAAAIDVRAQLLERALQVEPTLGGLALFLELDRAERRPQIEDLVGAPR